MKEMEKEFHAPPPAFLGKGAGDLKKSSSRLLFFRKKKKKSAPGPRKRGKRGGVL